MISLTEWPSYVQVNAVTLASIVATTSLEETVREWILSGRNVKRVAVYVVEVSVQNYHIISKETHVHSLHKRALFISLFMVLGS